MSHLCPPDGKTGFLFQMCGTTYPNKNYCIRRPASSVSCLETVTAGTGVVRLDGREYRLEAGDSYLLPEGHDHVYFADRDNPWEKIWVNFGGEFSRALLRMWGLEGTCVFRGLDLSDLLLKLQTFSGAHDTQFAAEQCTGLMMQAFARMSASLLSPDAAPLSPARQLQLYIEQHATEPLRVEQLAAQIGLSPSQAQRVFHAKTGIPLYRYVLDRKIGIACQLLRETGMPVREIAAYLSFDDEFYFSGLFRRKVGVSPSQYRTKGGT